PDTLVFRRFLRMIDHHDLAGTFDASSFSPSCSCTAVKIEGADDSPTLASTGANSRSNVYSPVRPVRSTTGRRITRTRLKAMYVIVVLRATRCCDTVPSGFFCIREPP